MSSGSQTKDFQALPMTSAYQQQFRSLGNVSLSLSSPLASASAQFLRARSKRTVRGMMLASCSWWLCVFVCVCVMTRSKRTVGGAAAGVL